MAGGNQILNPLTPYEGLGKYPRDKSRILQGLTVNQVDGVIFLSGDRHHSELIRIGRRDSYDLYDYTSSPLMAGTHGPGTEATNTARVEGTLVTGKHNFGLLGFSGKRGKRLLTLSCLDADGAVLWTHELPEASLKTPK